jgi:DNA-binding XRE family transcriptional regulator
MSQQAESFPQRVEEVRNQLYLSQEKLADELGGSKNSGRVAQ